MAVVFIALGWPLMKRKVPPNGLYGFRLPATLADPVVWYEANALAGRDFVILGLVLIPVNGLLARLPWPTPDHYATVVGLGLAALVIALCFWELANVREIVERRRRSPDA